MVVNKFLKILFIPTKLSLIDWNLNFSRKLQILSSFLLGQENKCFLRSNPGKSIKSDDSVQYTRFERKLRT